MTKLLWTQATRSLVTEYVVPLRSYFNDFKCMYTLFFELFFMGTVCLDTQEIISRLLTRHLILFRYDICGLYASRGKPSVVTKRLDRCLLNAVFLFFGR